jgi:archaemetzincin
MLFRYRFVVYIAVIVCLFVLVVLPRLTGAREAPDKEYYKKMEAKKKKIWAGIADDGDFTRMGKPRPGEWLHRFRESGQDFEDYKKELYNRKTKKRYKIYIIPLGKKTGSFEKILNAMKEYGEVFFGCEVVLAEYQPIPKNTYNADRKQYHAGRILDMLRKKIPGDAVVFVGFTDEDLYVPDLNFVFGLGSLGQRVGVFSMHRYGADFQKKLLRSLKVMNHEIGHIFSMCHCIYYHCTMNGSNSLTESDSREPHLCPVCLKKLAYANNLDVAWRYDKLAKFYKKHKFFDESLWCKRRAYKLRFFDTGKCLKTFRSRAQMIKGGKPAPEKKAEKKAGPADLYSYYWRLVKGDGLKKLAAAHKKKLFEYNLALLHDLSIVFSGKEYGQDDELVAYWALMVLEKISGKTFGEFPSPKNGSSESLSSLKHEEVRANDKAFIRKWEKWWNENKDSFEWQARSGQQDGR